MSEIPDPTKVYISPSKDSVFIFVDGEWVGYNKHSELDVRISEHAHILALPKGGEINAIMSFCQRYMSNEEKVHLIEYLISRTELPKIWAF